MSNKILDIITLLTSGHFLAEGNEVEVMKYLRSIEVRDSLLEVFTYIKNNPLNSGKKWTYFEDQELYNLFKSDKSVKEISIILKRTELSILSRLEKNRLIKSRFHY